MERLEEAMTASVQYQDALQVGAQQSLTEGLELNGPLVTQQKAGLSSNICTSFYFSCLLHHFQSMFDYLDNTVIKLCDMSTVGTDLGTVKQQIEELKVCETFGSTTLFFVFFFPSFVWPKCIHDDLSPITVRSNTRWRSTSNRSTWRSFATRGSCS